MAENKLFTASITLTNSNTNYNIYTLCAAIRGVFPRKAQNLSISAPSSNSAVVLLGDSTLSATQYGRELPAGGTTGWLGTNNSVPLENFNARSSSAGQVLQIEAVLG